MKHSDCKSTVARLSFKDNIGIRKTCSKLQSTPICPTGAAAQVSTTDARKKCPRAFCLSVAAKIEWEDTERNMEIKGEIWRENFDNSEITLQTVISLLYPPKGISNLSLKNYSKKETIMPCHSSLLP